METPRVNVPEQVEAIPIRKKTARRICNPRSNPKIGQYFDIPGPYYSFGPYYPESDSSAFAKDRAWKKIIEMEGRGDDYTTKNYMSAMRRVEKEARAAYGCDAAVVNLTGSKFLWMMIKDGCFFLQLTLYLLNDSGEMNLGYPDDDPIIIGMKRSSRTLMGLIKSMFFVGNQIPLVVLSELMKLEYFRTIIDSVKWWVRPSDMLSKQILYDLLVDPVIPCSKSLSSWKNPQKPCSSKFVNLARSMACWSIHAEKPPYYSSHRENPSDLLHGLQLFLLGPPTAYDEKADEAEQLDEEFEEGDLEAGIKVKLKSPNPKTDNINYSELEEEEEKETNRRKQFIFQFSAIQEELNSNKQLTTSNVDKKGIYIWNDSKGGGSRGIDFKSRLLWGSLFMPPLKVNHDTNVLFTNLKYYEIVHKQKEVRSYINFLANLVSTYEDMNVLASNKVIDENTKSEDKERFLDTLRNLSDREVVLFTHRHHSVIGRVKDYSVFPWEKFKYVAIIVFALTILQTIFGILSYFVGRDQLHQQESATS